MTCGGDGGGDSLPGGDRGDCHGETTTSCRRATQTLPEAQWRYQGRHFVGCLAPRRARPGARLAHGQSAKMIEASTKSAACGLVGSTWTAVRHGCCCG